MRGKTKAQARLKDKKTARPKSAKPAMQKSGGGLPSVVRATCPDCDTRITFAHKPRLDEDVVCSGCDSELIVVSLSPIELDFAD